MAWVSVTQNIKVSVSQAVEAHKLVRRRGSHIFLDKRLTDGGEVVSPFPPGRLLVFISAGRIRSIEKSNYLIGNRTRDFRACTIVPQLTTLLRAPVNRNVGCITLALKRSVFRVVTPCSPEMAQSFGETYRLPFPVRKVKQAEFPACFCFVC
jgi:predicted RNA binding protein YcfA (HicA-like mRNA interferase family)